MPHATSTQPKKKCHCRPAARSCCAGIVIQPGNARALSPPMPLSVSPSQCVVVNAWPKIVTVPVPAPNMPPPLAPISSTRCAGSVIADASRYGAASKICRPLMKSTSSASAPSQCVARTVNG